MGLKAKYAPETFLSNPQRLRKYAIWSTVSTIIVSLAAAATGWAMIATGDRHFMRSEPGYFYVQALMFTFMFLANAPGPYTLRTSHRTHIQYAFFAAFALALVSLPVGCYALGKAFNHKTRDNFLDACIGWDFEEGGTAACRRSEKALRAYVAAAYVLSWIVQSVALTFVWYYYRHLSNAFAEAAEEEEKAMLRPMSYASTRGSRMSYASAGMGGGGDRRMSMGGDRRMSSYGGHQRASSASDPRMSMGGDPRMSMGGDPRMSMSGDRRASNRTSRHAPSPQNTYRQSILRNSVVVDEQGRQRGSILMNRDDVDMARDGNGVRPVDEPFVPNPYSRHSYGHARGESYGPTNREAFVHSGGDSYGPSNRDSYGRENRMSLLAEDNQLVARDEPASDIAFPTPDARPTPPGLTPPGSEEYFDPYSPAPAHSSNSDSSYTGNASSGYPANHSSSGLNRSGSGLNRSGSRLGHSNSNSGLGHSEGTAYGASQDSRATSASEHATMKPAPSRQVSYSEGPAPGQAPSRRVSFEEEAALREQLLAAQGREAQRQAVAGQGAFSSSSQGASRESVTMPGAFSSPEGTTPDGAAPARKRVISFDLSGSAPPTPGRVSRKSSFARLRGMLSGSKDETQPLASTKH
ncbi:uncharacterized protein SCHCODRAFT_02069356 [Schizophyllum commune H4-8]|uniref:Uncharacterized protein n=1 Tax=Schizophyllum commune (strain H4-8 / FGSC 9210) TaxID=578458 RepID=D8QFI1_SCHCM|nr:uncharacterized protein SCHCODRAFT_02069356 [Schizophyllum commune H4-8]KAI5887653.1 hypothetical protein SCHCODRAFT_02069356 [Schizophyllum commune H4-8]